VRYAAAAPEGTASEGSAPGGAASDDRGAAGRDDGAPA
jgi:hypothetical protein